MKREIQFSGSKIVYHDYGRGKPLMLVHGFGEKSDVWNNQIPFLQKYMRIIVPDVPGSGESGLIADMSMEGMADALKVIVDTEGLSKFVLVGHSMGGYISLAFTVKYASLLAGLGLFHSTAFADSEEKKATRRKGIAFIREHGAFEFLKSTTPSLFSPQTKAENQPLIDSFIEGLNNFSPQSLVSYYEAMIQRSDRTEILTSAIIPVLIVMGEHDNAIPLQESLKLCGLPEKAYIHILRKSGHMGMIEEADYSNEILKHFFDGAWLF